MHLGTVEMGVPHIIVKYHVRLYLEKRACYESKPCLPICASQVLQYTEFIGVDNNPYICHKVLGCDLGGFYLIHYVQQYLHPGLSLEGISTITVISRLFMIVCSLLSSVHVMSWGRGYFFVDSSAENKLNAEI